MRNGVIDKFNSVMVKVKKQTLLKTKISYKQLEVNTNEETKIYLVTAKGGQLSAQKGQGSYSKREASWSKQ